MSKIPLIGGAYQARSIIANAQRSINLYCEINPQDSPFPTTHYPTPGLTVFGTPPVAGVSRGDYRTTSGALYSVVGQTLYSVDPSGTFTALGTLTPTQPPTTQGVRGGTITAPGSGYPYGAAVAFLNDAPFTGGSGTGARGNFISSGGQVVSVVPTAPGSGYASGDVLSTVFYGVIATGHIVNAGAGYANNTYLGFPAVGGAGTGARASVIVAGGVVTTFTVSGASSLPGVQYTVGDILTVNLPGGGTGFQWQVDTVSSSGSGFTFTLPTLPSPLPMPPVVTTPVSMIDNGLVLVLVDGTQYGYAVDISPSGQIIGETFAIGSGYTDGTYSGVPLNGGTGNGATADITISGGFAINATIAAPGTAYSIGDVLTVPAGNIGSGTGFSITITSASAFNNFRSIVSGDPVSFYGATRVDYVDTFFVFNRPGTNQWYISISEPNFEILTSGSITTGMMISGGANYDATQLVGPVPVKSTIGLGPNVYALVGGSGAGATGTITINNFDSGAISSFTLIDAGTGYEAGDVLQLPLDGGLFHADLSIITGGAGYTNGTFFMPVVGGSGIGAWVVGIVAGGVVTQINQYLPGRGYKVTDILGVDNTALGGSGFQFSPTKVSGGFSYLVSAIAGAGFDPLDIAAKVGYADPIQTLAVMHREIWLIGQLTTEVWYNTGAADFTFGIMPGVFIEHGCVAPYSLAKQDLTLFWLSQDLQGQALVIMGAAYQAKRISTHAIEQIIQGYATITDAIGFTYQQGGHVFYVLQFPTANATWVYDATTELWHQRASVDVNGVLNRHPSNNAAFAFGLNLVGDFQTGTLYSLDQTNYTDNGITIPRIRSFPHIQNEDKRVNYTRFIADMEVGNLPGVLTANPPPISLRWSDDRGATYGNAVEQNLGSGGQYKTSVMWPRLGMARDRVFELSWSADVKTALNGAYIEVVPMGS